MTSSPSAQRSSFLDSYRGFAVLLMILFHFCWDLRDVGWINFDVNSAFWVNFRTFIVFMFTSAVGWSSYLAVSHHQPTHRFIRNQCKVGAAACLISAGTFVALPNQWVFFGILHFIFLASFFVRPLSRSPMVSCLVGVILLTLYATFDITALSAHKWFTLVFSAPSTTLDFINPIPWLAVVLIGPLFGYLNWHRAAVPKILSSRLLTLLGKHALLVYLLHQLILYPLVVCAYFLVH